MERTKNKLSKQLKKRSTAPKESSKEYGLSKGNRKMIISTGSTLLDLEITGMSVRGGGIPGGILVEISGPSGCGKTVMLCEIAGNVQALAGEVLFNDPEGRLQKQFAKMFGFDADLANYQMPNTVPEIFAPVRKWKPKNINIVNGIFADSLAALSTELELEKGDTMGMRRAKEFSQECRLTCRVITKNNFLMVCSNQLRDTGNIYGESKDTPGGNAIPFYASLRLRFRRVEKIHKEIDIRNGKKLKRVIGTKATVEVWKSSVGESYGKALVYIIPRYGVDDIRGNLQWEKEITGKTKYWNGEGALETAVTEVEQNHAEEDLRNIVIDLWEEIQKKFDPEVPRIPKKRF